MASALFICSVYINETENVDSCSSWWLQLNGQTRMWVSCLGNTVHWPLISLTRGCHLSILLQQLEIRLDVRKWQHDSREKSENHSIHLSTLKGTDNVWDKYKHTRLYLNCLQKNKWPNDSRTLPLCQVPLYFCSQFASTFLFLYLKLKLYKL